MISFRSFSGSPIHPGGSVSFTFAMSPLSTVLLCTVVSSALLVMLSFWVDILQSVPSVAVVNLCSFSFRVSGTFSGILSPVTVPAPLRFWPSGFFPGLSGNLSPVSEVSSLGPSSFCFSVHLHGAWFALQMYPSGLRTGHLCDLVQFVPNWQLPLMRWCAQYWFPFGSTFDHPLWANMAGALFPSPLGDLD